MDTWERHTAFDAAHPAVAAVYVVFTLGLTMFSLQPALIAISLTGGLAYGCCARGWRPCLRSLRWQLPLVALIAVLNPLFVQAGSTELFRVGTRAVYLESFGYGLAMGGMFMASVLWFWNAGSLLSFEAVMSLFGNAAPTVALMVSMCMRLIPRFVRQGRQIAAVQDVVLAGADDGDSAGRGAVVRARLRQSTVLMGWAMEDSLQTADAMRARGWGSGRRTTYSRYRFTAVDGGAVAALAAGGALCAAIAYTATAQYSFYPAMSALTAWWGYVPYAAWMLLPAALHLLEGRGFDV